MTIASIYSNHYQGETFRAGVAYLRARSVKNDRAPRIAGSLTLDQQRQIIARQARRDRTIIVAEFIDYGRSPHTAHASAFSQLIAFAGETGPRDCYVVDELYLAWSSADWEQCTTQLRQVDTRLITVQ